MPLSISVVIPYYNGARFIGETPVMTTDGSA
jgi:hypothetical protein